MAANFMQQALDLAHKAATSGEIPVGAVIVRNGKVIAAAHNLTETNNDPSAHGEILAIRAACAALGNPRLKNCDLYVTLEPCTMCAAAISFARIRRLYFGAYDAKGGGVEHGSKFYNQPTCHHSPEVIGGVMETDCAIALKDFFANKR